MSIGEFARGSRLSPKALRLYDELGLLSPARVDEQSGYRSYQPVQLERARLIATLRQIGIPLATIKELVELDPAEIADRVTEFWRQADAQHELRQELVAALVDGLIGRSTVMYEVASREMPARSLLCLKRNIHETEAWALGKEFIGIIRDPRLPRMPGREGAMFSIYWGQVSADSDGPMEWCKVVPDAEAAELAEQIPELTLRVEPAHREAYVDLGPVGPGGIDPAHFALAEQALWAWADRQRNDDAQFSLNPGNLGLRITYLASRPPSETTGPDCDVAVPIS